MGVQDDFSLWERELSGPPQEIPTAVDRPDPREKRPNGRGMFIAAALAALGCTTMIVLGQAPLGVVGLMTSALILFLWRTED